MMETTVTISVVLALILLKWGGELGLEWLNQCHVREHSGGVPRALEGVMDSETFQKSIRYTLERSRFQKIEGTWTTLVLVVVLFSGVLPWGYEALMEGLGRSLWSEALYIVGVGLILAIPSLPLEWYHQFHLEERFGFNTMTPRLWWVDRIKGVAIMVALAYPLLALILKLVELAGPAWWLWAWGAVLLFQLGMLLIAPVVILPLFNRFTPLPEGDLRDRLMDLARKTRFQARNIQLMDGSRRSRHSNAFFTGFGRFRKIVLFDTLVNGLETNEVEAVLAHEIGHYKKRHILKMMGMSSVSLLIGFYVIAWLAKQSWFYGAFGFEGGSIVPALLLFGLLSGTVSFWFSPLANLWSRRYEYQADAYARRVVGSPDSLIQALRKLNEQNLSNLLPHRWYSRFYYSHPTLIEREQALTGGS